MEKSHAQTKPIHFNSAVVFISFFPHFLQNAARRFHARIQTDSDIVQNKYRKHCKHQLFREIKKNAGRI